MLVDSFFYQENKELIIIHNHCTLSLRVSDGNGLDCINKSEPGYCSLWAVMKSESKIKTNYFSSSRVYYFKI